MATDTKFVKGADKLRERISTIRRNLNLPALEESISVLLHTRTMRRFDQQTDPDGNRWPELKPSSLKDKKYKGYAERPMLVRTKDLRSAIRVIRGGVGTLAINTGAGFRIGVEDRRIASYGRFLNFGTAGMKARRFLGIGALDIKAVDSLLRRKAKQIERL